MVKTLGSVDKVLKRKPRKDIGKKHKTYKGKPCKHKPRRKYQRKIGNKRGLWLRAYYRVPMSKDGYKNWKIHLRPKIHKEVTNMKLSPTFREVPFEYIDTKNKFEQFFADNLWEGKFVIMGGSNAKTKTTFKPVKICTISIKETENGNIAKITESVRLHKYKWFYKG